MFGISMWELVLIVLVALILLGPRQLTETARVVGKLYRELLRLTSEVKETINLDTLSEMSTPKYEPPPPKTDMPRKPAQAPEILSPPGEKTGPDFYAELLEQSAETPDSEPRAPTGKEVNKQEFKPKEKAETGTDVPEERGPIH